MTTNAGSPIIGHKPGDTRPGMNDTVYALHSTNPSFDIVGRISDLAKVLIYTLGTIPMALKTLLRFTATCLTFNQMRRIYYPISFHACKRDAIMLSGIASRILKSIWGAIGPSKKHSSLKHAGKCVWIRISGVHQQYKREDTIAKTDQAAEAFWQKRKQSKPPVTPPSPPRIRRGVLPVPARNIFKQGQS